MQRRNFLAVIAGTLSPRFAGAVRAADVPAPGIRDEDPEIFARIADRLKKAGIDSLRSTPTRSYLSAGDLSFDDRLWVGRFCDGLLSLALGVFGRAGFAVKAPGRRLNLVLIQDPAAFARLRVEFGRGPDVVGFHNVRLRTVFARAMLADDGTGRVDWPASLWTIEHEALHQFTYSCGLLTPGGDAPACLVEGLATIGDVGEDGAPTLLRGVPDHLRPLLHFVYRNGLPLEEMIRSDESIKQEPSTDRRWEAYARGWLLVRALMTDADLLPRFRAYLGAIASRTDPTRRLDDARAHLGDLDALATRVVRLAGHLIQQPPSRLRSPRRATLGRPD